jgi:3-isopropylmalate/(R)-2-methylmalate dehydratase small subunit
MTPFTTLTATAAPLAIVNVDTDMIIPKQFLKTIQRTGLKEGLFYEMRFTAEGTRIDDFILHRAPYTSAEILISLDNFGCGSSREHAPWALLDFGFRCIIAPSYADIFYSNCFKNGILPVVLPQAAITQLMELAQASDNSVTVDLPNQLVRAGNQEYRFEIDPFRKHCLLGGLDDIGLTLEKQSAIDSYETRQRTQQPWLATSTTHS